MSIKTMYFDVEAGKWDGFEENCKYCDSFTDAVEAIKAYHYVSDYPWARISLRLIDEEGNTTRTLNIEGGDDHEMMLRLAIASLWMHTTQQSFIDVAMPVDDQLADIKRTVTEYRNTINRDKALIKRLTNELAAAQARLARITAIAS